MFTGLVETVGTVGSLVPLAAGCRLEVEGAGFEDMIVGDSVAVNGVCLTVTAMRDRAGVAFDVSPETLTRSNLGGLRRGASVNLERALRLSDRLGGHLVSGHIDGTGTLAGIRPLGDFVKYRFWAGPEILDFSVQKGSIAVDGISLTIAELDEKGFGVAVIPHTAGNTTLSRMKPGDKVNLEADLIGKYVARFMERRSPSGGDQRFFQRLKEEGFVQ